MIGMLRGTVWSVESDHLILDVSGVGYLLNVPAGCLAKIRIGEEQIFHTHLLVREDDLSLYGFIYKDEKDFFNQLLGVSGIGPKAALAILSVFSVKQVKSAILREDHSKLTEVPGIGNKIAKRLILELKEKIKDFDLETEFEEKIISSGSFDENLETLLALGFSRIEARNALNKVDKNRISSTEDQIKEALRLLAMPTDKRQ